MTCHNGIKVDIKNGTVCVTTPTAEKIVVKAGATIVTSGVTTTIIKDGVLRIQSNELDSVFNFQSEASETE